MVAPLVIAIAIEAGIPWLSLIIPAVYATTVALSLFPPQPGPVALVEAYGADMGMVYVLGIPMAIIWVIVGGLIVPRFLGNLDRPVPSFMKKDENLVAGAVSNPPKFATSILVPLSPAIIIDRRDVDCARLGNGIFQFPSPPRHEMDYVGVRRRCEDNCGSHPDYRWWRSLQAGCHRHGVGDYIANAMTGSRRMSWLGSLLFVSALAQDQSQALRTS